MKPWTQVELTSPDGVREVWWLPVPQGRAKVGEKITRTVPVPLHKNRSEDWTITQVCATLPEDAVPENARKATTFVREAQTIAYMTL